MSNQRTHYVTTTDGVTIGGTVHGQGPALVFLQGAVGDGDLDWQRVLAHLTDQYTCHLPSLRGRGLSGDHPDLSPSRIVEDFATYTDSIGEPVGLVGWSGGGYFALGVAASRPEAVAAVAPWEPGILSLMDEAEKAAARYVPNLLNLLQQGMEDGDAAAVEDPAVLGTISAPVMVLLGSDTKPFFIASARYVAEHVPNARVHEIPGAGHAAPLTHPEALAQALIEFFTPAHQSA